jgi:hypothetical protein
MGRQHRRLQTSTWKYDLMCAARETTIDAGSTASDVSRSSRSTSTLVTSTDRLGRAHSIDVGVVPAFTVAQGMNFGTASAHTDTLDTDDTRDAGSQRPHTLSVIQ